MADIIQQLEAEEANEKPYDASDAKQVNEARKRSGRKKVKERETYQTLMQYENGRQFVWDSIRCVIENNPVQPGDPYSTYFNLGQEYRARGILQEVLKISPKEFALMCEENMDDK